MRLPQAIAHRGYKAAYPENTLGAFRGAVGVGSHAIETDLHLSKDGVVVLSHVSRSFSLLLWVSSVRSGPRRGNGGISIDLVHTP